MDEQELTSESNHPTARALDWVCDALGGHRVVVGVTALPGGMSSAVHKVRVRAANGLETDVVLKRFLDTAWLAREPDLAVREVTALDAAHALGVPASPSGRSCRRTEVGSTGTFFRLTRTQFSAPGLMARLWTLRRDRSYSTVE